MFQSLRAVENYLGCGEAICVAFEYDVKVAILLLMTCFGQFNPISQACATKSDVPNSRFEECNMFGVKASMEESSHALVVGNFIYSKGYQSSHLHVSILFLGGNIMKINFQILVL
jgi:hypothetical protein